MPGRPSSAIGQFIKLTNHRAQPHRPFQDVEVFESFENLHGRLMREVQTQTQPEKPKIQVDRAVQTAAPDEISPEERRASRINYPHQSDC
ncbi:hypothetical protein Y032_0327g2607 [Ancylostoma ceylanicum]|uniref:Uncharacterized protein n=1 Tax=Ancylostoma ceylanicum TaxID=53326 RepID=A0A016S0W7_9BILA|nr:hypothetical protein Y032_0327g2607 [Ancylostoma ceylanicum]